MLQPASPQARRERILDMGSFGSGKTSAWLNIARWSADTGSPAQFYVLDTDNALEAFFEPGTQFAHLDYRQGGNVHWTTAFEWPEYEVWIDDVASKPGPDDWMIIDFVSTAWDAVQNYYVAEVFKQEVADFFMEFRRNQQAGNPLDGWKDWQYINKLYKGWMNKVLHKAGGHKFLTAQVKPVMESDDRALRAMFGGHGVRPAGQKELGYQVHSILHAKTGRPGEWTIDTVKDRERTPLVDHSISNFTVDYLVNVAGWQL